MAEHAYSQERMIIDPLYRLVRGVQHLYQLDMIRPVRLTLWPFGSPGIMVEVTGVTRLLFSDDMSRINLYEETNQQSLTFALIQPRPPDRPPDRGLGNQPIHMIGIAFSNYRYLLVDLYLPGQIVRTAVQVPFGHKVLDIYRVIAKGKIRLKALLTTSFTLIWQAPEGVQIFRSYEVPRIPSGSCVFCILEGDRDTVLGQLGFPYTGNTRGERPQG